MRANTHVYTHAHEHAHAHTHTRTAASRSRHSRHEFIATSTFHELDSRKKTAVDGSQSMMRANSETRVSWSDVVMLANIDIRSSADIVAAAAENDAGRRNRTGPEHNHQSGERQGWQRLHAPR